MLTGGGEIDPALILRRSVTLRGVFVGSRQMFEAMNRMIALHRLRPVIDRVFPFAEAKDAYRHLKAAGHLGKIVIRILTHCALAPRPGTSDGRLHQSGHVTSDTPPFRALGDQSNLQPRTLLKNETEEKCARREF